MNRSPLTKTVLVITLIIGIVVILYFGRSFLIPLAFGGLLAMLFTPLAEKLERKGFPGWASIFTCVTILLILIGLVVGAMFWQTNSLVQDWPNVKKEFQNKQTQFEEYLVSTAGIPRERIEEFKENLSKQSDNLQSWGRHFFGSFVSTLASALLVIAYLILMLMERERFTIFLLRLAPNNQKDNTRDIIWTARNIASQYLVGRLILMAILTVFYIIGFLIFGLPYAIPIALLAAVLSIIPYVGNIIGGVLALGLGMVTTGGATVLLGVLGTMTAAQMLENYLLEPWIVGRKVTLNPLFSIVSIIGFGVIWGISGAILALPIVGILKEFFDHIKPLKPYGFLLGDEKVNKEEIEA